ncbi:hypothetical protein FHX34_103918 [Actinoplanes teichomyceticus]|uniref:Uncharacterized protein n=1 Tax=Actinoplanes teichomyceticus TaxID=1867 RepID=A0A561WBY2_ACTTI|nr:hypothetical protein FHX34_103918 [Actinoplanes teichomyceticus]GIF17181.1 hypothetical protein Ate01nite_72130 [Actinoplanes teichomyceticus]
MAAADVDSAPGTGAQEKRWRTALKRARWSPRRGYGLWLYGNNIAPDAVEVRTPHQVVRLVDEARIKLPLRPEASA